jgi:glycosyltransferase involved in cell wall biosynthesis
MSDSPDLSHTDVSSRNKRGSIGYVFSGYLDASSFEEVAEKRRPRSEFHVFLSRYDTDLVTFEKIVEGGALARTLARLGRPVLGVAVAALERRRQYRALLTTGENVGYPAALYSRLARARIPINVITHGSFFGSPYMHPVAYALRSNRNVRYLTLSEALRMQMITRFGFVKDLVVNIGYGVDTEFFKPQASEATARPIIASAGVATRDYRALVAATHDLNVDVRIAADSAWFPAAVDISPDRLPANCEAKSYGNYLRLRELYAAAAFVVVPLYPAFHACGLAVIAEAMAMGKAVITTRIAGRSDFIVEGENGYYVEPCDADGLRAKIKELLDDPARAIEMGLAARSRMTRLFTLEAYVDRMIQAIGE